MVGCHLLFWLNLRFRLASVSHSLAPPLAIVAGSVWNPAPLLGVGCPPLSPAAVSFYRCCKGRSTYLPWWGIFFLRGDRERRIWVFSCFWGTAAFPFPQVCITMDVLSALYSLWVPGGVGGGRSCWRLGSPQFLWPPQWFHTVPSAKPHRVFINLPIILAALLLSVSSCSLPQVSTRLSPVSLQVLSPEILSQLVVLRWV